MATDITSDLEVWYKGDGSGSTLTDYSGGSIGDGTLNGNAALVTGVSDHPNGLQNAVARTANGGAVESAGDFTIPETSDVTFSWWQKLIAAGNAYIINTNDGGDYSLTAFQSSATAVQMQPGTSNAVGATWTVDDLTDNGWHHYVMIYDGTGKNGYLWQDGSHTDTDSTMATGTPWPTDNKLRLFDRTGGSLTMKTQLCDVRVYSRALASSTDPDGNIAALFAYTDSVEDDSQQDLIP